ncbi:hypothetical protein T484DRAFT_3225967 [Baffinella frigidus]|nr:hypothetical protein T484DRAFT_3225967 [Cryptophyta sp. CCMP2293]
MQGEHQPLLMAGAQPSAAAAPGDYSGESRVAKAIGSIPPGVLGLALGLSGLAGVWVCAARFLVEPGLFDEALPIIVWILLVPAAVLILLYGSKSIFAPAVAERELLSAAGNSSLATGTMATMSIALMLHGQGVIMPAKILWFLGMLAHVTFLLIFSVRHLRFLYLPEKLEELTPSWVIPPIGIAIATSTGLPLVGGWVVVFFWSRSP